MTPINQTRAEDIQSLGERGQEGYGAAISTTFAVVAMTAFLWTQIVSGLVPPVA